MFCKFATPVTLLHGLFLMLRVVNFFLKIGRAYPDMDFVFNVLGMLGAGYTITKGFGKHWSCIFQYRTVWNLVLAGIVAAASTQALEVLMLPSWSPNKSFGW